MQVNNQITIARDVARTSIVDISAINGEQIVRDKFEREHPSNKTRTITTQARKIPHRSDRFRGGVSIKRAIVAAIGALASVRGAQAVVNPTLAPLWLTTADQSVALKLQPLQSVAVGTGASGIPSMTLNRSQTYQAFQGVGGALTESAAIVLSGLPQSKRDSALALLFDAKTGIGINQLRYPAGPSDFSMDPNATYLDKEGGTFSLGIDMAHRVPLLKQILAINPSIRVISAPWSPPAWMKTSQSTCGGHLKSSHYDDFADYLKNFIQAYSAMGVHIGAITPQNEPLQNNNGYPSTGWNGVDEADFIEQSLGPTFAESNIDTQIWGYDHNYNNVTFPSQILSNASQYVTSIAFHCYAGDPAQLSKFTEHHPGVEVHLTECSGGTWDGGNFSGVAFAALNALSNGAPTALLWNIALTETGGPTFSGDTQSRGILSVSKNGYKRTSQFEVLGHVSKFVQPGAVRVDLDNQASPVYATAFRNPDDTVAVVAFNPGEDTHVEIQDAPYSYAFDIPSMGMTTLGIGFDSTQFAITAGVGAMRAHAWSAPMVAALVAVWVNTW